MDGGPTVDGGSRWCATHPATKCFDFDETPFDVGWDRDLAFGGTLQPTSDARSFPFALASITPAADGSKAHLLTNVILANKLDLELEVKLDPGSEKGSVLIAEIVQSPRYLLVYQDRNPATPKVTLKQDDGSTTIAADFPANLAGWVKLNVDVDFDLKTVTIRANDQLGGTYALIHAWPKGAAKVGIGITQKIVPAPTAWTLLFDNVRITY